MEVHTLPEPPQKYSLVANHRLERKVDCVQVIDRSASMGARAYAEPAVETEKLLIDLIQSEDKAGIVSFGASRTPTPTEPTVDYTLTEISGSEAEKDAAKSALYFLSAARRIPMGAGMRLAQAQLASTSGEAIMVLVSDGYKNVHPYAAQVLPGIVSAGIDVYAIALGTTVDKGVLQQIVGNAGGKYYNCPTIEVLQRVFLQLRGDISGDAISVCAVGELASGEEVRKEVDVDPLSNEATFVATWLRPTDSLGVEVFAPNGQPISSMPAVEQYADATYVAYRVQDPQPGTWRVHLSGSGVFSAKADYAITGLLDSGIRLSVLPHTIKFLTGDRALVAVRLEARGEPVVSAEVHAYVATRFNGRYCCHTDGIVRHLMAEHCTEYREH